MFEEYFKILGLEKDASQEEIKKAYRLLAKKFHPDVSDDPEASEKFIQIAEAYEILINRSLLYSMHAASQTPEERQSKYEYFKQRAKETAQKAAEMRYEKLQKEHEAFQKSGMHDIFLLFNYFFHFLLIVLDIFLITFPVVLLLKVRAEAGIFLYWIVFWIIGTFLAFYIIGKGKSFFYLGPFFYSYKDLKKLFIEELGDGTVLCSYCRNRVADSFPYKISMLKVHDVQLKFFGAFGHDARYRRSLKKINIPRSKKAFRVHFINSIVKILVILMGFIFLPFESLLWRFIISMIIGGSIASIILFITRTRSKVSYLLTGINLVKIGLWLLLMILLCEWSYLPDIRPNDYLGVGFVLMLFLQDVFIDLIFKFILNLKGLSQAILTQPREIQRLADKGYQNYLEIPGWSTIFPIIKWIF